MGGLSMEQLTALPWCDVELRGITWAEGGRELRLELWPPSSGCGTGETPHHLLCARWARGIRIDLHQAREAGGYLFTWDVLFEQDPLGEWSVHFDFGSAGSLSFKCTDLVIDEQVK